jgi:hypothetical protein
MDRTEYDDDLHGWDREALEEEVRKLRCLLRITAAVAEEAAVPVGG